MIDFQNTEIKIFQSEYPLSDFLDVKNHHIYWLSIPNTELFWNGNLFGPVSSMKIFHKWRAAHQQKETLLKQLKLPEISLWGWQSEYAYESGKLGLVNLNNKEILKCITDWNLKKNT